MEDRTYHLPLCFAHLRPRLINLLVQLVEQLVLFRDLLSDRLADDLLPLEDGLRYRRMTSRSVSRS